MILVLGISAVGGYAQTTTGTYVGFITDSSGNLVAGVKVTATNEGTGLKRSVVTGNTGEYQFSLLPIGKYTLSFEASGFKPRAIKNLKLDLAQTAKIDITLEVGEITDAVAIEDTGRSNPLARTENAETGEVIDNKRIVDLPLNGRLFLQLAQLTPGVSENSKGSFGQQLSGFTGPRITVMGARESDNYFTLDGISITDKFYNTLTAPISVDAIQEFKVQSKLYSAESGTLGGSQINIAIKSGTNSIHGSMYGFTRNDKFDARNFFDQQKSEFRQHTFGATVGGPIIQNKAFYFGNYEGFRMAKGLTRLLTVPTNAQRQGIFSTPIKDPSIAGCTAPTVTQANRPDCFFSGNQIPTARFNNVANAFLNNSLIPRANFSGSGGNYLTSPTEINDNNQFTIKTNYRLSDKDDFAVRYTFFDLDGYQPFGFVPLSSNATSVDGYGQFISARNQNVGITHTHVFSENLIGEAKLGFNRIAGGQQQENTDINFLALLQAISPGAQLAGYSTAARDLGVPRITGITANPIGDVTSVQNRRNNDGQVGYNLSWFAGKHSMNIGGGYKRIQFNPEIQSTRRAQFDFFGGFTGNAFADFLLGLPTLGRGTSGDANVYLRGNEYSAYVQDDFKLSRRLTFNLGVRYDYFSPLSEKNNKWSTLDIKNARIIVASEDGKTYPQALWAPGYAAKITNTPVVTSEQAGIDRSLQIKDRNNVAPRFGFAFDLLGNQKTVLRGGYGIVYSVVPYSPQSFQSNAGPFVDRVIATNIANPTLSTTNNILQRNVKPGFTVMDITYKTPYYQQWSFGIQQSLINDLLIEAQYLGSKGTNLSTFDFYFPTPNAIPAGAKPGITPDLASFQGVQTNGANSNYHAGVIRVEKRLSRGLMAMGSYTYSKSIDEDSLGNSTVSSALMQSTIRSLERALSSFDIRHRAIISLTYDLPYKSDNKLMTGLLGNWQVGSIITQQSGQPFSINLSDDRANVGIPQQRPNLVGNPNLPSDQRTPQNWFNTAAFVAQPIGSYGNAGRNILEGPGTNIVDFSLLKSIPINERQRLQFRTEVFNLFNHTNFEVPNRICNVTKQQAAGTLCSAGPGGGLGFGQLSAARDPRIIQFGLKYLF